MPKKLPDHINAGEILLNEVCQLAGIDNWRFMSSDEKKELIAYICDITDCDFNIKSLDRIIKDVENELVKDEIPKTKPTYCTLCYLVCKVKLKLNSQSVRQYKGKKASPKYVNYFTDKYLVPLLTFSNKNSLSKIPEELFNSCWYAYVSLFNRDQKKQRHKLGIRLLKIIEEDGEIRVEYILNDISLPDWEGSVQLDATNRFLILNLKTKKNFQKHLHIILNLGQGVIPKIMHGTMTYIAPDDTILTHIVVLEKIYCNANPQPRIVEEGQDKTITDIEEYFKKLSRTTLKFKPPVHTCRNELNDTGKDT